MTTNTFAVQPHDPRVTMEEEELDFCKSALEVAEQVIHSVVNEFVGGTKDRQHELIDLSHEVLEYAVLLETLFSLSQDLVEELRVLVCAMSLLKKVMHL